MDDAMTPTEATWHNAGRPAIDTATAVDGRCWLCGGLHPRGMLVKGAIPKTFLQAPEAACPEGTHVCEPCIQMLGKRKFAFPGRGKPGGKFGPAPCNLSHGLDGDTYWNATKGEKPAIRAAITRHKRAPWFISVADSGQKHVLPFARMQTHNGVGGWVRFETQDVFVPDSAASDVERVTGMLNAGGTKAEVASGEWSPRSYKNIGVDVIRAFEAWAAPQRGGAWWALLVWVCQREEA